MALRITNIERDISKLNKELTRLDGVDQELQRLRQEFFNLKKLQRQENIRNGVPNQNNVTFTWTGSSGLISWNDGYVKDHHGNYLPVRAGSTAGVNNTYYWAAWNPVHKTMSFQNNLDTYQKIPNALIVCQVFTGTGAQTATIGGGGSEPGGGSGLNGKQYKLL